MQAKRRFPRVQMRGQGRAPAAIYDGIFPEQPTPMLVTPRLVIRPFIEDDAVFIVALLNDPDWLRFIGDRKVRTLDDARVYLRNGPIAAVARNGHGLMQVLLRADDECEVPIGMCGLIKREGLADVDLGFAFLPAWRKQGYAREAAEAVLRHGREVLGIQRVVAITLPDNIASTRLLTSLGMRFDSMMQLPSDAQPLALYILD